MNERIKKLAEQAGMYVDLKGEPWPKWMGAEECEVAYKKFAELIVEECRNVLTEVYRETPLESCGYLLRADEKIAEHFYEKQQ